MLAEDQIDYSILATIGNVISWLFIPQGWGNWQAAVASITGLVAKENIVGTLGILYGGGDAKCICRDSLPQLYCRLPDIPSWHSTCCVHRASQQWVQSSVR